MTLSSQEIALHIETVRATEAFVYHRTAAGRYALVSAVGGPAPQSVELDDEPLAAAAVRDGVSRTASYDSRRVVAGYDARSAALVATHPGTLVIIGRRDGCLAGVDDDDLIGTVDQVADRLRDYETAGVSRVMLQHLVHADVDMVELIGRELAPRVARS